MSTPTRRPRRKRKPYAAAAALALMFALAVLLGAVLNNNLDSVLAPEPVRPTVSADELINDRFADEVRASFPGMKPLSNQGIVDEVEAVCADLDAGTTVKDMYDNREFPVDSPADASRFLGMALAWKCPTYMPALADLTQPAA